MVVDELLPLVEKDGLSVERIALMGWSMGGYGALRLGGLLGSDRVAAVGSLSAALWTDAGSASPSGFADAAEYEQYTVFGHQDDLDGIPVRLDCGTGDPFLGANRDYADGQPFTTGFQPGGHDTGYWTRMLPDQLAFLGGHLAG
jgi:S-formylglutathione hydrolase FrmB